MSYVVLISRLLYRILNLTDEAECYAHLWFFWSLVVVRGYTTASAVGQRLTVRTRTST
jgi:hypothetical protein